MDDSENHVVLRPVQGCGTGVLVLAGSSGAIDRDRAQLLADHGAVAMAMRWFGGRGQQPGPWDVPLESFVTMLDALAAETDRLAVLGASFGAEAALCVASRESRVDAVVAVAPSAYVWGGVDDTGRATSHWTWRGAPLPYVPMEAWWAPSTDPLAYRGWYEASVTAFGQRAAEAAIPVEDIAAEVLLIAGGDDRVWPSDCGRRRFARVGVSMAYPRRLSSRPMPGIVCRSRENGRSAGVRPCSGEGPRSQTLASGRWPGPMWWKPFSSEPDTTSPGSFGRLIRWLALSTRRGPAHECGVTQLAAPGG